MNKSIKKVPIMLFLFSILLTSYSSISLGEKIPTKKILYISSYYTDYKWSNDIYDGIKSVLVYDEIKIDIQVEYMDTHRTTDTEYIETLKKTYELKYKSEYFDVIISSDDAAFSFLKNYADELFPNTPIVFCGVNYFEEAMISGLDQFTGVVEGYDIGSTIETALELHPEIRNIYYIDDNTITGQSIMKEFESVMPLYSDKVKFIRINGDLQEIEEKVSSLPTDSIILFLIYFKDSENNYAYDEAISRIEAKSKVPIYGVWDFVFGSGIVGGKLTSGYYQGTTAAKIALQILNGVQPQDIPVIREQTTQFMFDYSMMKKFNIDLDMLPSNSIIINLEKSSRKQILILNSYNKGLQWTDDIETGIKEVLGDKFNEIDFTFEYMDVKKNSDAVYIQKMYEFLEKKYENIKFDLIITTDDEAFNFMRKHHDRILKNTPIIFSGVNHFEDKMIEGKPYFTGVVECYDLQSTLELALSLHPKTYNIIVINDNTLTGKANKKNLELIIPQYQNKVTFEFWEDVNMVDIQENISSLEEGNILLLLSFNRDKSYNTFSYDESIKLISKNAKIPIYGVWDFYLGEGLLGGMLSSGKTQGQEVGKIALQILDGKKPIDIPVIKENANKYMFDYKMLKKYSIKKVDLPENSIIINQPFSYKDFYSENRETVQLFMYITGIILILLLSIIVVLLTKNIKIRKTAEEKERFIAMTDSLTGIPNRRAGLERLGGIINSIDKTSTNMTICFVDVNNLKQVNDIYGHSEGDVLIIALSTILTENIRPEDALCRLGGDEFLIIFNNATLEKATEIYGHIKVAIKEYNDYHQKPYKLSVSQGFAQYDHLNCKTIDELIEKADNEMYQNKMLYKMGSNN